MKKDDKIIVVKLGIYDPKTQVTDKQIQFNHPVDTLIDIAAMQGKESAVIILSNLFEEELKNYFLPLLTDEVLQDRRNNIYNDAMSKEIESDTIDNHDR